MNAGRKLWEVYVVQVNPNLEDPLVAKTFKAEVVHELLDQCAASGVLAVAFARGEPANEPGAEKPGYPFQDSSDELTSY